jgi:Ca-activated chloride channel family protein
MSAPAPLLVLQALGALVLIAALVHAALRRRLFRRPVLGVAAVLACLPPLVAGMAGLVTLDLVWFRLERSYLAVPCFAAALVGVLRLLRLSPRQSRVRRALHELFASATLLMAALAATGLELGRPLDRLSVLIAIDRSRSIDLVPNADSRIAAELRVAELSMREEDRVGSIAFGATAATEDPLHPRSRLPAPQRAELGRDGTDIGAALRHALGELPPDSAGRIVLLTDGVATRGDALSAALAAVAAGVPIDAVPLDQAKVPDVRVVSVRMPPRASEGEPLELRVVTSSPTNARAEVRIFRDGKPIRKGKVELQAGEDVLHLREVAPPPGFHRYDVEISAEDPKQDHAHEDNAGSAFVRVRGESSALVLERQPALAAALVHALEAAAFRVHTLGPTGIPADVAGFAAYDLVVLGDIPAHDLSPTQMEALASYVRDLGGGLLLFGGEKSLGPGGYGRTPIEEVSPVSFDVKQERRRASLAEIIAVDYSGSMAASVGSRTKLELANEAAVRSAELLGAGDKLGVMHVDTTVRWTVPLGPVTNREKLASNIRAVGVGGGGIYVDLALNAAFQALAKESAQLKHCLLFSDGADAEERTHAFSIISRAKADGITTSVVALGNGSDVPDLEQMSRLGGGRFYLIEDATRLPAVFAQETVLAARSAINELSFQPALATPGPPVRGIDFRSSPPLTGYVVTLPKARSQVHLSGPEGDPILVTWSAGVGRAAAFTSDYRDRWGVAWTSWPGAARLFGQLARDVARRADDPRARVEADALGGVLNVRVNLTDEKGRAETFRRLRARVAGPDGFTEDIELEAVGSGAYAAPLPLGRPGAYVATVLDEKGQPLGIAGAALNAGEELRPTGTDRALLARIAELSGGKVRDTLAGIFNDRPPRRFAYSSESRLLALAAALALLGMVTARRLSLPERVSKLPARVAERRSARHEAKTERSARRDAADTPSVPATPVVTPASPAQAPPAPAASDSSAPPPGTSSGTLEALRRGRARSRAASSSRSSAPPSVPPDDRAERPLTTQGDARKPPPFTPAPRPTPAAPPEPPPGERSRSAAEILLERRRGRKN